MKKLFASLLGLGCGSLSCSAVSKSGISQIVAINTLAVRATLSKDFIL
ncbi:hypothetical protein [Pseudanabaena sp. Chao 1811]|nr:hypothetical protein [Pseudanabaena sp. Chao 1811]